MKPRTLVVAIAAIAAVWSTRASMQQPPAGGGAPGGGCQGGFGGFKQPDPIDFNEHDGWTSLFDGKTLNGWSGDSNWKVEDGAIVIESTCEKPTGTVYLVWKGGEAADFELKMEMKGTGQINGGGQYRGWIAPRPQRGGGPGGPARGDGPPAAGAAPPAGAAVTGAGAAAAAPAGAPGAQAAGAAPGGGQGAPGGGRANQGPCPSGAPRGTPPDA